MAAYYVYFTDRCRQDVEKYSVTGEVEKFATKLEQGQSILGLRFSRLYLRKRLGKGRIIIEECKNGDDIVLCLARYHLRKDSEYETDFLINSDSSYFNKNKVPKEEVETFLKKRKRIPIDPKKSLSENESAYLQSTSTHHYTDDGAYMESYDWFERTSKDWVKNSLPRYYDLIELGKLPEDQTIVCNEKNPNIKILYRYFPKDKRTFLIAPIDRQNPNDEKELRKKHNAILDAQQVDLEELVRKSRRAYPSIIACDEDTWKQVQDSDEANLALSPEEERILESVLKSNNNDPKYPLFINGRPGSGKSTILQYLFSDHLEHYIELNASESSALTNPPLYLTYSRQLLEQARSSVGNILTCGAKTLQEGKELSGYTELINQSFRNFQEFLLEQLSSEEKEKFVSNKYISFEQFRKNGRTNDAHALRRKYVT